MSIYNNTILHSMSANTESLGDYRLGNIDSETYVNLDISAMSYLEVPKIFPQSGKIAAYSHLYYGGYYLDIIKINDTSVSVFGGNIDQNSRHISDPNFYWEDDDYEY